jgi:hypothetical protein
MFNKKYQKYFTKNYKLNLSYNGLINQSELFQILNDESIENNYKLNQADRKLFNPFLDLIGNYKNVKELLESEGINIFEFFYLNKYKIHKILYDDDNSIFLESNLMKNFSDYYYLYLLIKAQPEIINYKYDYELIKATYDMLNSTESIIKKIIYAKMLLCFISNYEEGLEETNRFEEEIKTIKDHCIKCITNNKYILEKYKIDLNLDNIENNNISIIDIYYNIIITLIKNNQLNGSSETINILNELDIKDLRLDKQLFDGLKEALDKIYLSKYEITNYDDFFDESKLMFYCILFEYILKSSDYIFHIPFLFDTRSKIIEIIKENHRLLLSDLKKKKSERSVTNLLKVLGYFVEKDYYLEKKLKVQKQDEKVDLNLSKNNSNQKISISSGMSSIEVDSQSSSSYGNNSQSQSYKGFEASSFLNKSDQKSAGFYSQSEQKQNEEKYDKVNLIFSDSEFKIKVRYDKSSKELNIKYISIIYKDEEGKDITITEDDVKKKKNNTNDYYSKFVQYLEQIETELKNKYKKEEEINITLKFKKQNSGNDNYNIRCDLLIDKSQNDEKEFKDEDLFNNTNLSGVSCMLEAILGD